MANPHKNENIASEWLKRSVRGAIGFFKGGSLIQDYEKNKKTIKKREL